MKLSEMKTNDEVFPAYAKYREFRREHPLAPASTALRYAKEWDKTQMIKDLWDGNGDSYTREVDGFTVTLKIVDETIYPEPRDTHFGEYVGVVSHWSEELGNWNGNYPQPKEELPLNLPYTTFAAAAFANEYGDFFYWVPDGVDDAYEGFRNLGQSKSVAWDLTREWAEEIVRSYFSSPLTNGYVAVTVNHGGIELATGYLGTDYLAGDPDSDMHLFDIAEQLLAEAMDEAKDEINRLKEVEV